MAARMQCADDCAALLYRKDQLSLRLKLFALWGQNLSRIGVILSEYEMSRKKEHCRWLIKMRRRWKRSLEMFKNADYRIRQAKLREVFVPVLFHAEERRMNPRNLETYARNPGACLRLMQPTQRMPRFRCEPLRPLREIPVVLLFHAKAQSPQKETNCFIQKLRYE